MRQATLAILMIAAHAAPAGADNSLANVLVGPVLGVRLSGKGSGRGVIGVEGGVGWGPERINLGFEHRSERDLYYLELDPWLWIGGSFGLGIDSAGEAQGIIGLWEGVPVAGEALGSCRSGFSSIVTLSGGIRYTGVVELYVTLKAGQSKTYCFD